MRLKSACQQRIKSCTRKNQNPEMETALFYLLLGTGLRGSEVVSLNVDQYRQKVLHQVMRHKSKRVSQKIALPQESRDYLDRYLEKRAQLENAPLFITRYGTRLQTMDVYRICLPTWQDVINREYESWDTKALSVDTSEQSADESVRLYLEIYMKAKITIRYYQPSDAKALASIYYYTIHNINVRDYSIDQIEAWAPTSSLAPEGWEKKWDILVPLVVEIGNTIVGFVEFEPNGHIDCFYVHHEYQGIGIGSELMRAIETLAKQQTIIRIYAEVSITAKPFFEKNNFKVVKEQNVMIRGSQLTNYMMEKILPNYDLSIRQLKSSDIPAIVEGFKKSNWTEKPAATFELYLNEQQNQKRIVWVAFLSNTFVGYVTLKWESLYMHFKEEGIPEIMDLNVLPNYRNLGIGSSLLDTAEKEAASKASKVGLGVGLYTDYGAAQKLYIKRDYKPDGHGITYNYQPTTPGCSYILNDDLLMWFTKKLV